MSWRQISLNSFFLSSNFFFLTLTLMHRMKKTTCKNDFKRHYDSQEGLLNPWLQVQPLSLRTLLSFVIVAQPLKCFKCFNCVNVLTTL